MSSGSESNNSSFIIALGKVIDENKLVESFVEYNMGCFSQIIRYSRLKKDLELKYDKTEEHITLTSFTGEYVCLNSVSEKNKIYKLYYLGYEGWVFYDKTKKTCDYNIDLTFFNEKIQKFYTLVKEHPEKVGLKETSICFGAGLDK